jgi:tight adherence protein B
MAALFAIIGAALGASVLLLAGGLRPAASADQRPRTRLRMPTPATMVRAVGVLTAAALVGAGTGWPVAAILAAVAAWTLPDVLGPDRAHRHSVSRIEAVAGWAEDLTGTLRSAAGLEQAIVQTAQVAPPPIRPQLAALAAAPTAGIRLPQALRAFADELGDPTADLVTAVLIHAAHHQARDIAASLAGVGATARRHAAARVRIATGRARTRTATRIVITVVLACTAGMFVFARDFLTPYASPLGQAILAVLGLAFGGSLAWMIRIARVPDLPRILTGADHPPHTEKGSVR